MRSDVEERPTRGCAKEATDRLANLNRPDAIFDVLAENVVLDCPRYLAVAALDLERGDLQLHRQHAEHPSAKPLGDDAE